MTEASPVLSAPAPVRPPTPAALPAGRLYQLEVRLFDLHGARRFAQRLVAAGVPAAAIQVRGRRCADGLAEADVRPWSSLTTRWRLNAVMVVTSALVVGLPVGASLMTIVLGEHAVVTGLGAVLGMLIVGAGGLACVAGDHLQRFADTRPETRLEGLVTVTGDREVVRAEHLLTTTEAVMEVRRR